MAVKKTELIPTEEELQIIEEPNTEAITIRDSDILNPEYDFDDKIGVATTVATSLKKVIQSQNLTINIQGNDYVTAEGWETLGTMLGCTPYVESVE